MIVPGTYTLSEIHSQPAVWMAALDILKHEANDVRALLRESRAQQLVFTGCGSTYYAAVAVAAVAQELTGIPARALPASELWLNTAAVLPALPTLLVAISRSGETTETLRAVEAFRAAGRGMVLTLGCSGEAALARTGDLNLVFPQAQEQSVAQTRAFSTLYLAGVALATLWAGDDGVFAALAQLPAQCQRILEGGAAAQRIIAHAPQQCFFLGSGSRYGLACELSLKMKEMSLSVSEPFHFLEFRHGPQSMADDNTLIVGLLSEAQHSHERAVLDEMRTYGAHIVTIGARDADVVIGDGLPEVLRGPL